MAIDWQGMDDATFGVEQAACEAEGKRRAVLRDAEQRQNELNEQVLAAEGIKPGDPWRQPTGAHDAYPLNARVAHNSTEWDSLVSGNVWEPGVSGWREVTDGDEWPLWVAPTGSHDAYPQGAQVTHNGQKWTSDVDSNVWEPGTYGWTEVVAA